MKSDDLEKIYSAGLITAEQRDKIISHFRLNDEGGKFLTIISFIGAILIAAGFILLISANWNDIPAGVKIASGLALMLGAHGYGWWLREVKGHYLKTGEALQLVGSALFLANIALLDQIYHLESRTPNALLLWLCGIVAFPWLLRSRAQLVLCIAAFGIWLGCEVNERDSLIYLGDRSQILAYALIGLNFLGAGLLMRRTSFAEFSLTLEKVGALSLLFFSYPLTWSSFWSFSDHEGEVCQWIIPVLALVGSLVVVLGVKNYSALNSQWRRTWAGTLVTISILLLAAFYLPQTRNSHGFSYMDGVYIVASIALFVFCLVQVQVGVFERAKFLVNLAVAIAGLVIISTYFGLFGTMAVTGAMFVMTGVFLIVFGVLLEKKRRKLMAQIKSHS